MPPIQNQHITPTALQNIQFLSFYTSLFLSLMEALQIQTRLGAERTRAEGKQRWRYDYLVKRQLV